MGAGNKVMGWGGPTGDRCGPREARSQGSAMTNQLRAELLKQVPDALSLTAERRDDHFDFHICTPLFILRTWEVPDPALIRRWLTAEGHSTL